MAKLSASDAVGAGFGLIRRRPLSVLVWGLFAVVVIYGPLIPAAGVIVPAYLEMIQPSLHPETPPDMSRLMGEEMRMFGALAWMWPLGLIAAAINLGAVYRAVLEPQKRSFAYLRVGMQEVWLLALMLTEFLLVSLYMIAAGLVVALGCVVAARFGGGAVATLVGLTLGLASVILAAWLWLRLSLAAPMTFAAGKFRLFESWALTRGHAGQLMLLVLLLIAVMTGLSLVLQAIEGIPFLLFDPFGANPEAVRAWFAHPPAATVWAPWVALGALVSAVDVGVFRAVLSAPWAAAYKALIAEA